MNFSRVITCVGPMFRVGISRVLPSVKWVIPQTHFCICISSKASLNDWRVRNFEESRYKYYSKQSKSCWKCTSSVDQHDLFCRGCNSLQKIEADRNYFDLFGLGEKYNVDTKVLHNTFRDLQRLLHPDVFSNKDEEEKKLSEEHSSLVNKAYSTLTQPLRRGLYMLRLKGIDIEKDPVSMGQDFLIDIMERNEEVDGLKDLNKIQGLSQVYKNIMLALTEEVENAFNKEDLEKAKEIIAKMKYFSNLEVKLRDLKRQFGIVD